MYEENSTTTPGIIYFIYCSCTTCAVCLAGSGGSTGNGTISKYEIGTGQLTAVHNFLGYTPFLGNDGRNPGADLIKGAD